MKNQECKSLRFGRQLLIKALSAKISTRHAGPAVPWPIGVSRRLASGGLCAQSCVTCRCYCDSMLFMYFFMA